MRVIWICVAVVKEYESIGSKNILIAFLNIVSWSFFTNCVFARTKLTHYRG